jgi:hypothetical protein
MRSDTTPVSDRTRTRVSRSGGRRRGTRWLRRSSEARGRPRPCRADEPPNGPGGRAVARRTLKPAGHANCTATANNFRAGTGAGSLLRDALRIVLAPFVTEPLGHFKPNGSARPLGCRLLDRSVDACGEGVPSRQPGVSALRGQTVGYRASPARFAPQLAGWHGRPEP